MKKNIYGRKFKRDKNERKALFKGLMSSFILNGKIETTQEKAKAIKPNIEKLVTKAKKNSPVAKILLQKDINPQAAEKLIRDIAPRFSTRSGGYTRIIRLGRRVSDSASKALIEWVEMGEAVAVQKPAISETQKKTEARKKKRSVSQKKLSASVIARKNKTPVKPKRKAPARKFVKK